jgi:large subunit ribosomal protein L11
MGKKETVNLIVKGGAASAGPPLGPALAGKGINIGQVVKDINAKTAAMAGMDVPVKVVVDPAAKSYEIQVGLPPSSALLKKEASLEKGSGAAGKKIVSVLAIEHIIKVAQVKGEAMLGSTLKNKVKELLGTCVSLGIRVEGKDPRAVIKEVNAGIYDKEIKAEKTELSAEELEELKTSRERVASEMEALEKAAAVAEAAALAAAPVAGAEVAPAAEGAAAPAPGAPAAVAAPKQPAAKEEKKAARKEMR